MCGRVRLSSDVSEIKLVFSIPPHRPTLNFAPSWNLAPTDPVPIVRYDAKAGERSLDVMRWGLVPFWAKDIKVGFSNINAKAEGIEGKPAFREAFQRRRCESAWNKDPVFGVIGIQSGPPGRRVHSGFRGGCGGQVGDAGSGDDCEDPSGVFRPEQADQDDLPRASVVAESRAQGDPIAGDRVSL
jgi:hypothetical protein